MNIQANFPQPGLAPSLSVNPAAAIAAVVPMPHRSTLHRIKDLLVSIYAYGLLAFGVFFPPLLAAWYMTFGPIGG